MTFEQSLALMLFAHCVADYPLQGDFLSKAKNHKSPLPGVPWSTALVVHGVIHAGFVGLITGSVVIAALELTAHSVIDYMKSSGRLTFNQDQAAHIICKVFWVALMPILA